MPPEKTFFTTKNKLLIFVALPLSLIILLIFFSAIPIGKDVQAGFLPSIERESLTFQQIEIGTLTLNNQYLLPRRLPLPAFEVCMVRNRQTALGSIDAGSISISAGEEALSGEKTVSVGQFETRNIMIQLHPNRKLRLNANNTIYTDLLLVEEKNDKDVDCRTLDPEEISSGTFIYLE